MMLLSNLNLTDMEVCYKVFKSDIITNHVLKSNSFDIDAELTVFFCKNRNLRIYEVPISIYSRNYAEGKKITLKAGFVAVYKIFYYRFFNTNIWKIKSL